MHNAIRPHRKGFQIVHRCDVCAEQQQIKETPEPIETLKGNLAVAFAVVSAVMFAFGFYVASAIAASYAISEVAK